MTTEVEQESSGGWRGHEKEGKVEDGWMKHLARGNFDEI